MAEKPEKSVPRTIRIKTPKKEIADFHCNRLGINMPAFISIAIAEYHERWQRDQEQPNKE